MDTDDSRSEARRINEDPEMRARCEPVEAGDCQFLIAPSGRAYVLESDGAVSEWDFIEVDEEGLGGAVETEGFDVPTALLVILLRRAGWTVAPPSGAVADSSRQEDQP